MYSIQRFFSCVFIFSFMLSCSWGQEGELKNARDLHSDLSAELDLPIKVGAQNTEEYLHLLKDKNVGVVANQTSILDSVHLVDFLLSEKIAVQKVYSPEHGFRGDADAGEHVKSNVDAKTKLPVVSLYGSNKKPKKEQLLGIDVVVFDLQDVGVRFYTYISTLHYVMEACAENNIKLIVLDRPNPNIDVVDGPIREEGFESFVGMHPIPILHGMTIGEYAQMINGEFWLKNKTQCGLVVIPCLNYNRKDDYHLPINPSPNLRSAEAIYLYPSLCLFEGTVMSVGRGTDTPFELFGHPKFNDSAQNFKFQPVSSYGAKSPKLEGEQCKGKNLHYFGSEKLNELNLDWLIEAYNKTEVDEFFSKGGRWFDLLAGTDQLRKDILAGKNGAEIKSSWQSDLNSFKQKRSKYLIYK